MTAAERLIVHNARWKRRFQAFCASFGGGWWGRGTIISPDLRHRYNSYLPPDEFHTDLRLLAQAFFTASPERIPSVLNNAPPLSLPDLWATLEDPFTNRVTFSETDLLPLFCNLAEPSRMGTDVDRYPRQRKFLQQYLPSRKNISLLDIGCGIGLGTCELAALVMALSPGQHRITGVTSEALAVWMACHRQVPHNWRLQHHFTHFAPDLPVTFHQGFAETFNDSTRYDIIVCNGLAGGRFLNTTQTITLFLESCANSLADSGVLLLSNHFHAGNLTGLSRLVRTAHKLGWRILQLPALCGDSPSYPCSPPVSHDLQDLMFTHSALPAGSHLNTPTLT